MDFRVLGPLEVRVGDQPVELGPHKQRALLALLLVHVGRVVSTDRILEDLWGDDAVGKEKALWVHISRLRSALEPQRVERGASTVLLTRDHGYLIDAEPDAVDSRCFEAAVDQARDRITDHPSAASEILRGALALWRGSALQDFAFERFAQAEISRLEELRLEAVETRVEADLRCGQAGELVRELETLAQEHPLRERPVVQLMNALYRAGRQAEALRAFARFRREVGELGIEPSPELCLLEEQILLHDARLVPPSAVRLDPVAITKGNPFKGLQAFREDDANDFFGRSRLITDVVTRIRDGARLVSLVGPSGSGKSSVARAGVVAGLRKGALPGSECWLYASMVPGRHPFAELEAALLRATTDAPSSLTAQFEDDRLGLLRAVLRVLPQDDSRLVLVIDQFEELFAFVADEAEQRRFLDNLVAALDDPYGRLVVVLTLRADSYEKPLAHPAFAAQLGSSVINVLPLTLDELEAAANEPAIHSGVTVEPALLAELLSDVIGEAGALPAFQYALTELFDRRDGDLLTSATYRSIGGARGALSRRADDLYHRFTLDEQRAAQQLFLRLVTIGEHDEWGRRRVAASELVSMDIDTVTMESVIDQLGRQRFLTFDRDHSSGAPTVEVAHEALLWEWKRLRGWIEEGRNDVRRRASLDGAMTEWLQAGRDDGYLLGGKRLDDYEHWRCLTSMHLTGTEEAYLDSSVARRNEAAAKETARATREAQLGRRARRRWWGLIAVGAAVLGAVAITVFVLGPDAPPSVALVYPGRGLRDLDDLVADGFDRAARDFEFDPHEINSTSSDIEGELEALAESGTELIIIHTGEDFARSVDATVATRHPGTTWGYVDVVMPGAPSIVFAEQEAAFLVGAAAALTSQTGTIGFIGGFQLTTVERFRAGFEAGARAADPSIEILASYLALDDTGFGRDDLASVAASDMYQRGADVVFHAAGAAGRGIFSAAVTESVMLGRHVWAIGVDADQYLDVDPLERAHVLTSMIKKFDVATYELVRSFLEGDLEAGPTVLGLADDAVGYSTSGNHLSAATVAALEGYRAEIVAGTRLVPSTPSGTLEPPHGETVADTVTVTYDGSTCAYDGPTTIRAATARLELINSSDADAIAVLRDAHELRVEVPAEAGSTNAGYAAIEASERYVIECGTGPGAPVDSLELDVVAS